MPVRKYWTFAQIKQKIRRDLDLESEVFVRTQELTDYVNEAIDEAEAEIHSIYEDYFLTRSVITLVANQEDYDLPENIYAHKIRRVIYNNNASIYKVRRMQDWRKFEKYEIASEFETSDIYEYYVENSVAGSPKMILVPKSREDGAYIRLWYLRQANRLEADTDICDIPEFVNFIFQYVKVRIYEKEIHPNAAQARIDLEQQRAQMQSTLAAAQPDAENKIELDMSFYEEMN